MSKLWPVLALYAAVLATVVWLQQDGAPAAAGRAPAAAPDAGSADVRAAVAEVRALWRDELKGTLQGIDWQLAEIQAVRASMEEGLQAIQKAAEDSTQANYGMLESMREDLQRLGTASKDVTSLVERLAALEKRLKAVEDRPPQIIRETILKGGPGPAAEPEGPKRPTLPEGPKKDPEVVARESAEALKGLEAKDTDVLFPAIEKVREHRVLAAVPRLIEILTDHKDEIARTAAAAALGDMLVADAVPALAEAMVDKSDLVAGQADKAVRDITGFDTELGAMDGIRRRRAARNRVKAWWKEHEAEVRARLGQPASGS